MINEDVLRRLGIPVYYNDGTSRSLSDVLEDLSKCWDKLDEDIKKELISNE